MEITEEMKELEKSTQIEDQWKLYVLVTRLDEQVQDKKLMEHFKRCFYGGFTHLLMLLKYEMPNGTPDEAIDALDSMVNQANIFWQMIDGKPSQQN